MAPATATAETTAAPPATTEDAKSAAADQQKNEGDIVVTARKRSERLQDVPLSVAAVSGATMQQQGIRKIEDLQTKVPNFKMTETGIGSQIAIRGIFSGVNQGFEQSVGTYIDGIHYGRAQQARAPFLDVQRVEVLRGPQSILFGKNSIAGALNIISAQPTNVLTGYVQGNFMPSQDDWELLGAVSGPITDNIRARVAGRFHEGDGFMKNLTLLGRDEPQRKDWNLRGIVDWDVTDNFQLNFKAEHGEFDTKGRNIEVYEELPSIKAPWTGKTYSQVLTFLGALNPSDEFVVDPSVANNVKDDKRSSNGDASDNISSTYVLTANWDTGIGQLTSITGLNKFNYDEDCDCDFTGANILTIDLHEKYKQFSQEIRLASDTSHKFEYILGGFYQTSDHSYADNININSSSLLVKAVNLQSPGNGTFLANTRAAREAHVDTDILSAFGQLTYKFNDHFRFNVGAASPTRRRKATVPSRSRASADRHSRVSRPLAPRWSLASCSTSAALAGPSPRPAAPTGPAPYREPTKLHERSRVGPWATSRAGRRRDDPGARRGRDRGGLVGRGRDRTGRGGGRGGAEARGPAAKVEGSSSGRARGDAARRWPLTSGIPESLYGHFSPGRFAAWPTRPPAAQSEPPASATPSGIPVFGALSLSRGSRPRHARARRRRDRARPRLHVEAPGLFVVSALAILGLAGRRPLDRAPRGVGPGRRSAASSTRPSATSPS